MLPPYQVIDTPDRNLQRVQNQLLAPMTALLRNPLLDGILHKNVALTTAGFALSHGLGRMPLGWIVVSIDTHATVKQTARSSTSLTLAASTPAIADVWVF